MSEDDKLDQLISQWDKLRYVPKPGEPELPPQLSEFANKTTEDVIKEMNRLPFFMTELDETDGEGGENTNLEALRSLAYDGEPDEIATNFKNQGNDCYKQKKYKDAVGFYTQGLEVEHGVQLLTVALYLNRAACNLELKNYRRCIEDCKNVLRLDDKNVKAAYRAGRAFFAVERYDEAKQILEFGLQIDPDNQPIGDTLKKVVEKQAALEAAQRRKQQEAERQQMVALILDNSIKLRHISIINSKLPAEMLEDAKIRLETETDHESQLIFPAMVVYPTIEEFDFVGEISELTTPNEILAVVMDRPAEWFAAHPNFDVKKLQCFMETEAGGLVKVGKNAPVNAALMSDTAKAPLFDNALRMYVVPKAEVKGWLKTWNKAATLQKRKEQAETK